MSAEQATQEEQKAQAQKPQATAWAINFSDMKSRPKRSKKEVRALEERAKNRLGATAAGNSKKEEDSDNNNNNNAEQKQQQQQQTLDVVDVVADRSVLVPSYPNTTRQDLEARHWIDNVRMCCLSRPQYKATCGVSSLTSVWNFLYSRIGHGDLPPVTQELVMTIIGFEPPFVDIKWGSFTGNVTLMRWFHLLNRHFGVQGKAFYQWKLHGQGRTIGVSKDAAYETLKTALKSPNWAVIYHCHNHYMCPIGFQDQPIAPVDVYKPTLEKHEVESYVVIGEVSRGKHPSMHIKKFDDVHTDINCQSPQFFNIRHAELGVQTRGAKKKAAATTPTTQAEADGTSNPTLQVGGGEEEEATPTSTTSDVVNNKTKKKKLGGGNLHCFIGFRSDLIEENMGQFEHGEDENEEDEDDENDDANQPQEKKKKDDNKTEDEQDESSGNEKLDETDTDA